MPGYTDRTRAAIAFKKLIGLANVRDDFAFYNEDRLSQISIYSDEISSREIYKDPQNSVDEGIAEFVECELNKIPGSNGYAYDIIFPSGYSGFFSSEGASGGNLIREYTQIIPDKFNRNNSVNDHSGGYAPVLFNSNDDRVYRVDDRNWYVDPVAGVLTSDQNEDTIDLNSGKLRIYLYTGSFLKESLTVPDNEVAVGTSTPNLDSSSNLTFDGSTFNLTGNQVIDGTFEFDTSDPDSTSVSDISSENTLGGSNPSNDLLVTQKAVKEYIDSNAGGGGSIDGIEIEDDGSAVFLNVGNINFGDRLEVKKDGDGTVTVNSLVNSEFIQDVIFNSVFGGSDVEVFYSDSLDRLKIDLVDRIDLGTLS